MKVSHERAGRGATVSDIDFYPCDVHLLDTMTGERAVFHSKSEMDDPDNLGEFADFIWREGNYSCDCNRADFFAEAKRETEEVDHPCGHGRYVVEKIVRLSDGLTVYTEQAPAGARP
jgi:hypothetical protein